MEMTITHDAPTNKFWEKMAIEAAYPVIDFTVTINSQVLCISCEMSYDCNEWVDSEFKVVSNSIEMTEKLFNEFQENIVKYKKHFGEKFKDYIISHNLTVHRLIEYIEEVIEDYDE